MIVLHGPHLVLATSVTRIASPFVASLIAVMNCGATRCPLVGRLMMSRVRPSCRHPYSHPCLTCGYSCATNGYTFGKVSRNLFGGL